MQQKPIALHASQSSISPIEADTYIATLAPAIYASVLSAVTEIRKRLGSAWAERMIEKAENAELRILDVGGAGFGALAVQAILSAEWHRMQEHKPQPSNALTEPTGRIGGASIVPPRFSATVVVGSHTLLERVKPMMPNTTFVPRLPDYVHATDSVKQASKFDIIVAPHALWTQDKPEVKPVLRNLWNLLASDGGVLLLLEKGVPRGFECIAAARDWLLERRLKMPSHDLFRSLAEKWGREKFDEFFQDAPLKEMEEKVEHLTQGKETGMIVTPCTNHTSCPLYQHKGIVKGRRDICSFSQRYHRPAFLQNIYGTKGKNHEDVEFSYLSVMRGRDLRVEPVLDPSGRIRPDVRQGDRATDRAFRGYEGPTSSATEDASGNEQHPSPPHSLSLPRSVFPPLKRHGHVILDVCTPSGTLERWTIPKSFSRQAYRDARKSSWGDLWALGAKTRVPRNLKAGPREYDRKKKKS